MGGKPRPKKRSLDAKLQLIRAWVKHFEDRCTACLVGRHGRDAEIAGHIATVLRWALSTIGQSEMPTAILIIRARQLQYYNSYRAAAERPANSNHRPERSELWAVAENLADVVKVLENRYLP